MYSMRNNIVVIITLLVSVSPLLTYLDKVILSLLVICLTLVNKVRLTVSTPVLLYVLFVLTISTFYVIDFVREFPLSLSGLYTILLIVQGIFLVLDKDSYDKLRLLNVYIKYLALVSLCIYILLIIYPDIIMYSVDYSYLHTTHKTFYLANVLMNPVGGIVYRNAGIASEPALWAYILNLSFYCYLDNENYNPRLKFGWLSIVYILSIVMTLSIVGFISMCLILLYFYRLRAMFFGCLIIVMILSFESLAVDGAASMFEARLLGEYLSDRFSPSINIFSGDFSIFGEGASFYKAQFELLDLGSWDSFSQIYIKFGVIPLSLYLFILLVVLVKEPVKGMVLFLFSLTLYTYFIPASILIALKRERAR